VSNDAELGVIGARAEAGRLLVWDVGTSYAAPLVSRVAAAVRARHPNFSAELVRALVLLSSSRLAIGDELAGSPAQRRDGELRLAGYGKPSIADAIESTSHRAVLVAEGTVPIDGVHVYEVPVPSSFLDSGGRRGIDITLAYSPRTRVRRLDYLATRMEFHLVKGLPLEMGRKSG
jgi:subtilisin family serine protease